MQSGRGGNGGIHSSRDSWTQP